MASKGKRGAGKSIVNKVEKAKQELGKVTTNLMLRYEHDGFIDWGARAFANDYEKAVWGIVWPFLSTQNADALGELGVARLTELQRVDIDDVGTFLDDQLDEVIAQLDRAFEYGTEEQRARLLALLGDFLKENFDNRSNWICGFERSALDVFIYDVFAWDPLYAQGVIELADWHLEKVSEAPDAREQIRGYGDDESTRRHWLMARLCAMSTCGDTADDLYAYAESGGMLNYTESLFLIANAYMVEENPRPAVAMLREHINASEMYGTPSLQENALNWLSGSPIVADYMVTMAKECYTKVEMVELYCEMLLGTFSETGYSAVDRIRYDIIVRWYDELHRLAGVAEWPYLRAKLLFAASNARKQMLRAHEWELTRFHEQVMHALRDDVAEYAQLGAAQREAGVLLPATHYILYANKLMSRARKREDYHEVARALTYASTLGGEWRLAQEGAAMIAEAHPRKTALHDELKRAGFEV